MTIRFFSLVLMTLMLAGCGRVGPMLRPEPGVTIMKETDAPAQNSIDKPFVLDRLL